MTDPVVDVRGLRKRFGAAVALDGLDLTVERGEIAGFLGPNGSGKSTAIRVLLGLYRADGGLVRLLGGDPRTDAEALHRRLAYVPGDVSLWPRLTGGEAIDLLLSLRGARERAVRRDELIERFRLDPTKRAAAYSKGNRQKVALVAALAVDVELLILDEPTSGLDPLMEATFRECVREAASRGTSVLLSSHILGEVEQLCDSVTIIRDGRTIQRGTLADLRHLSRATVRARITGDPASLRGIAGVHDLHVDGDRVRLRVDDAALPALTAALAGLAPRELSVVPPSLEELFLHLYGPAGHGR
jgi:ABC-2 type transport system ATP-binding protein